MQCWNKGHPYYSSVILIHGVAFSISNVLQLADWNELGVAPRLYCEVQLFWRNALIYRRFATLIWLWFELSSSTAIVCIMEVDERWRRGSQRWHPSILSAQKPIIMMQRDEPPKVGTSSSWHGAWWRWRWSSTYWMCRIWDMSKFYPFQASCLLQLALSVDMVAHLFTDNVRSLSLFQCLCSFLGEVAECLTSSTIPGSLTAQNGSYPLWRIVGSLQWSFSRLPARCTGQYCVRMLQIGALRSG